MIAYASRTDNNEYIVRQLALPNIKIENGLVITEPFFILTYTDGLGLVPKVVSDFMLVNYEYCKGIIASGNSNFGANNFCGSADKLANMYDISIIRKLELRGFNKDYDHIKKVYEKVFT